MSDQIEQDGICRDDALRILADALADLSKEDEQLRSAIRVLGVWLSDIADNKEASDSTADVDAVVDASAVEHALAELNLGGETLVLRVPEGGTGDAVEPIAETHDTPKSAETREEVRPPDDPRIVIRRANFMAECCRWAVERRARLEEDAEFEISIRPRDKELTSKASAFNSCYAWPLDPYVNLPEDENELEGAAECYEALADALELAVAICDEAEDCGEFPEPAYSLLAEGCSALRAQLVRCGRTKDYDQEDAFAWLRRRTDADNVFISRHMRLDDPADPDKWLEQRDEIANLRDRFHTHHSRVRERKNLIGKLRYIIKRWDDYDANERIEQIQNFGEAVDSLVKLGVPASDTRIRECLLKIRSEIEDTSGLQHAMVEAIRHADEHKYRVESAQRRSADSTESHTPEAVVAARDLLKGKVVVLIGGEARTEAADALKEAFNLKELRWIATREHQPIDPLVTQVSAADVDLVILAIRWTSHSFGDLGPVCKELGVPLLRLPKGYGVNQVAHEVMSQVSRQFA